MNDLANCDFDLGQHADALKLREETLTLRRAKLGPSHPKTLLSAWRYAQSLVQLDRGVEAIPLIDDSLKRATGQLVDSRLIPALTDLRLRHFAKTQDAAGCRATADMWELRMRTDVGSLYDAACWRAVAAAVLLKDSKTPKADAPRLMCEESDRAMAWLTQAILAGYRDVAHIKEDEDLDALRDRDDFKELIADLERFSPPAAAKP